MHSLTKTLVPERDEPVDSRSRLDPSLVSTQHCGTAGQKKPIVILRMKPLLKRIGCCRSAVYDKLDKNSPRHDESFPSAVKISSRCVGWIESEINDWLESRVRATRSPAQNSVE